MGKILVGVPCMSTVPVDFLISIMGLKRREDDTVFCFQSNSLVYDARNIIFQHAVANKIDRILWIDSDMVFDPDLLLKLEADMDTEHMMMVGALCFKRSLPTRPCVYRKMDLVKDEHDRLKTMIEVYEDYPKDGLFECAGVGFGAVMMDTQLGIDVFTNFNSLPFSPIPSMGEDFSFCWKVRRQMGIPIFCDSRIKVGHVGTMIYTEQTYLSQQGG